MKALTGLVSAIAVGGAVAAAFALTPGAHVANSSNGGAPIPFTVAPNGQDLTWGTPPIPFQYDPTLGHWVYFGPPRTYLDFDPNWFSSGGDYTMTNAGTGMVVDSGTYN